MAINACQHRIGFSASNSLLTGHEAERGQRQHDSDESELPMTHPISSGDAMHEGHLGNVEWSSWA
jgi:hypothetical protein